MEQFLIFYAPFILVIISIVIAFWFAGEDRAIREIDK